MGTCHYLLKPEQQVAFDLGKGNWSIFLDIPLLGLLAETEKELTKIIAESVFCSPTEDYFDLISKRLFDWCGDDEIKLIQDDDWDDEEILDYLITQSRFLEERLPRCFRPKVNCTACHFPCNHLLQLRDDMSGMKTFFWADTHIGHKQILNYEDRPFNNLDEHDEALIENYNSVVGPIDRCIWIGDCFLTAKEKAKSIMERLNGVKIVVRGNHDHTPTQMMALGFHFACEQMQIKIAGHDVLLCHFPYKTEEDTQHEIRYERLRPKNNGLWLLHGHIHSKGWKFKDKMINVGVDQWGFKPIPMSFFETYIQKKEAACRKSRLIV